LVSLLSDLFFYLSFVLPSFLIVVVTLSLFSSPIYLLSLIPFILCGVLEYRSREHPRTFFGFLLLLLLAGLNETMAAPEMEPDARSEAGQE